MISDAIRTDPEWRQGDYTSEPHSLRLAAEILFFMGSNPRLRYEQAPTLEKADKVLADDADRAMRMMDANDVLYAAESSRDYDPGPALESIRAPLIAVNTADDLINPPDLGILEREIKRVPHGKAVLLPESPENARPRQPHNRKALEAVPRRATEGITIDVPLLGIRRRSRCICMNINRRLPSSAQGRLLFQFASGTLARSASEGSCFAVEFPR